MLAHLNSRITDPGLNKLGHMAQLVERSLSTYRYAKGPGFDSQSVQLSCDSGQVVRIQPFQG